MDTLKNTPLDVARDFVSRFDSLDDARSWFVQFEEDFFDEAESKWDADEYDAFY